MCQNIWRTLTKHHSDPGASTCTKVMRYGHVAVFGSFQDSKYTTYVVKEETFCMQLIMLIMSTVCIHYGNPVCPLEDIRYTQISHQPKNITIGMHSIPSRVLQ